MGEYNSGRYRYYGSSGRGAGVINDKEYGARNMYFVRSSNHLATPNGTSYLTNKPVTPRPPAPIVSSRWFNCRQLKRQKRIAKYKLYAIEGKVKNSLKKSMRWMKRTCSKIVRGF